MAQKNPFLPQKPPIKWRAGAARGTIGIPVLDEARLPSPMASPPNGYKKRSNGRKPMHAKKDQPDPKKLEMLARRNGEAGDMPVEWGHFLFNSSLHWGSNLEMLSIAHGAVGCGAFALTERLHLPGFVQGVETYTALDLGTDLKLDDLEDNGNSKLGRALDEARGLFPLAHGIAVLNEEPVGLINTDIAGITKAKAKTTGQLIVASSFGLASTEEAARRSALKAVSQHRPAVKAGPYNVALAPFASAPGLIWVASKLLREIGFNPVHTLAGSSSIEDLARIGGCKLIIGISDRLKFLPRGYAFFPSSVGQSLHRLFGTPIVAASFSGPAATDTTLRAIASRFDWKIQRRAEMVIAANRKKVDAIIAHYRPRLEGKLVLDFGWSEDMVEMLRLLGMRIGNGDGWPGKTGVKRRPRVAFKLGDKTTLESYIAEAKPDTVTYYAVGEHDWHKRGLAALPLSPLYDKNFNGFWAYDGFAALAAALDRHINAPWRKLVKPPWPENSG